MASIAAVRSCPAAMVLAAAVRSCNSGSHTRLLRLMQFRRELLNRWLSRISLEVATS